MAKVNTEKFLPRSQKPTDQVSDNLANIIETTVIIKKTTINLDKFYIDKAKREEEALKRAKREQVILKDKERKLKLESNIESQTSVFKKKTKAKKISDAGGFGKILDALVLLALGWLVKFLPDFIRRVELFIANLNTVFFSIKTLITQVGSVFKGLFAVSTQALENIKNFDFFDKEGKLQEKIDEMNGNFDKLGKDWEQLQKDVKKLSDDITAELPSEEQERGFRDIAGTESDDLFDVIAAGEGGYNSVNQGTAGDTPGGAISVVGKNLTDMTVSEVVAAQQSGQLFAVGKYQIIPKTMTGFIENSPDPIDMNDKFDAATQEKFKRYVIDVKRPAVGRYIRGESDNRIEAAQELAREFASVGLAAPEAGRQRGESRYSGTGGNRASITPESIEGALDRARSNTSRVQSTMRAPGGVGPVLTPNQAIKSLSDAKSGRGTLISNYGEMRRGGPHGGTDIAAESGTALTAVADGQVVDYGSLKESGSKRGDPDGWGNFLVYRDDKNYFHLYGHLLNGFKKSGAVKKGETIAKVGSTGKSSGPHLHWELGTSWTGRILTGKMDPLSVYGVQDPFSFTGSVSPRQAKSRTIERTMEQKNGRNAVVIGTPKMQPVSSSGSPSRKMIRSGGTNTVAVLNSISRVILAYT